MIENFSSKVKGYLGQLVRRKAPAKKYSGSSTEYEILNCQKETCEKLDGWNDVTVSELQDAAYSILIKQMYEGNPRDDLVAAANAIRALGAMNPSVLDVGCGSGYYSEILMYLLQHPIRYVGIDYSRSMIHLARKRYPDKLFLIADAASLPFGKNEFDIVFNGVSLMHIIRYEEAIAESHRVANRGCIFHSVPLLIHRNTTILRKKAYGGFTSEIIFNEGELISIFNRKGLFVRCEFVDTIPYNLQRVLGEPTVIKTFLCEVAKN